MRVYSSKPAFCRAFLSSNSNSPFVSSVACFLAVMKAFPPWSELHSEAIRLYPLLLTRFLSTARDAAFFGTDIEKALCLDPKSDLTTKKGECVCSPLLHKTSISSRERRFLLGSMVKQRVLIGPLLVFASRCFFHQKSYLLRGNHGLCFAFCFLVDTFALS